mgnify:CR=1 FL=1
MTNLLKTIQAEERKRFEKEFGWYFADPNNENLDRISKRSKREIKSFLNQAIQRTVEKTVGEIAYQLKMTIVFYEKELQKQPKHVESLESRIASYIRHELTHSPKEDKNK